MGGNALKNTHCVRENTDVYTKIKNTVLSKLQIYHDFVTIIEMPEKDSFGDLDIMYEFKNNIHIRELVNHLFSPKETCSSGDVFSFSYEISSDEYFQIDLIKVKNIDIAQFYYGYGVVGLILGLILKKNNLTLGIDGLWANYESCRIVLSTNPREICEYCGLDYAKWVSGFNTYNELFDWVLGCKYLDKKFFAIENLNHKYKTVYEKKAIFKQFIEYIAAAKNTETLDTKREKPTVLEHVVFFGKQPEKETIDKKIHVNKIHQEKFNGRVFLQYVNAKDINKYKESFKQHIIMTLLYEDFDEYLTRTDTEIIHNEIARFCAQQGSRQC
jgi:hypothetical protein